MLKKIALSTFLSLFLFFTLGSAPAQASWYDQSYQEWVGQVYNDSIPATDIFGERYVAAQTWWVVYALTYLSIHQSVATVAGENTADSIQQVLSTHDASNLVLPPVEADAVTSPESQSFRSYLATVFQERPMSGITYFKNKFRNLNLIPEAHAQTAAGFGFQALQPIQGLWQVARDISYSLFVLISIALAFMIMFRVKLSPQVVISVQSALPKIAVGLILVTFSYAIAGFMIDLMYVVIGLIGLLLSNGDPGFARDIFRFCTEGFRSSYLSIGGFIGIAFTLIMMQFMIAIGFITGISSITNVAITIIAILALVYFIIVTFLVTIRTFILIFKTLAKIFILTIIAPIQITLGIIFPQVGFSLWFKSFASALAVFPAIGLLSLLAFLFCLSALSASPVEKIRNWTPGGIPPGIDNLASRISLTTYEETSGWPPFVSSDEWVLAFAFVLISISLVAMIPKVEQALTAFIQGRGFSLESALTEAGQRTGMEKDVSGFAKRQTWDRWRQGRAKKAAAGADT